MNRSLLRQKDASDRLLPKISDVAVIEVLDRFFTKVSLNEIAAPFSSLRSSPLLQVGSELTWSVRRLIAVIEIDARRTVKAGRSSKRQPTEC